MSTSSDPISACGSNSGILAAGNSAPSGNDGATRIPVPSWHPWPAADIATTAKACLTLGDESKSRILEDFLHLDAGSIDFPRKNSAASRPHPEIDERIKAMISADTGRLDRACGSRYARLLFSPEVLDEFRAPWDGLAFDAIGAAGSS